MSILMFSDVLGCLECSPRYSFDDFESQTSKKYGSKFGGSPFLKDNFRDLQYNPADQAFYDYINNQNQFKNYEADESGKIIESSGVTIGRGVDLGQHNAADLKRAGFTDDLIKKFKSFGVYKKLNIKRTASRAINILDYQNWYFSST